MNQSQFSNIWIAVPFMSSQASELMIFIEKHKWLLDGGGGILLKSSSDIDSRLAMPIKEIGATLIQKADKSLYEAWNQCMDYFQDSGMDDSAYFTFLGLEDVLYQDFCIEVGNLAREKIDFIYGDSRIVFKGRYIDRQSPDVSALFGKDNYVYDVSNPGLMNRWGAVKEERFDARYRLAADFDFYIAIAQRSEVSFRHVHMLQAQIDADGISNSAKAKGIYLHEWALIKSRRKVKLNLQEKRTKMMRRISSLPFIFEALRRVLWAIRAKRL